MKKILYLTALDPVPKPGYGGPGRVIENLMSAFEVPGSGWATAVISRPAAASGPGKAAPSRWPVPMLPEWLLRRARRVKWRRDGERFLSGYARELKNREREILSADIVHSHDIYAAVALRRLGGAAGRKPLCLSVHAPVSTSAESAERSPDFVSSGHIEWIRAREAEALASADCVISPSAWALGVLGKEFGSFKRTAVLHNGIPSDRPARSGRVRAELGAGADAILVTALGRLVPEKGFADLIRVFKEARTLSGRDLIGVIAGSGPEEGTLKAEIEALGLGACFKLLGHRPDAAEILADSDVYVSSSHKAVFDLGMLEAMRAGLPILAADSGGNSEALGAGKAGQIFPAGDTAAAAAALALLASDSERRRALAKASAGYFTANYSLEAFRRKAAEIYESVLQSSGPVRGDNE